MPIPDIITEGERQHYENFKKRIEAEKALEGVMRGVDKKIQRYYTEELDEMEEEWSDSIARGELYPNDWLKDDLGLGASPLGLPPDPKDISSEQSEYDEAMQEYYEQIAEDKSAMDDNPYSEMDPDESAAELDFGAYEPISYDDHTFMEDPTMPLQHPRVRKQYGYKPYYRSTRNPYHRYGRTLSVPKEDYKKFKKEERAKKREEEKKEKEEHK